MTNEISTSALHARLNAGESVVLLDVRQPEEYAEKNIPNSILIPLGELPDRVEEIEEFRDKEIVVICRSGNRSGQACMFLTMNGFTNTVNLKGGMLSW
ncbi:MAG: rhodanese-like domain-containing protein [Candidatus Kapabacteria bacterium]|nr:rhodanese-like domain-containing protein [Candidatus Kapabacteria bacterium]